MRERIEHIIKAESLTNLLFAQAIEISPAAVTHILAGRNNPSLEIVVRIARRFPHYNLRWLLLGEGSIYCGDRQKQQKYSPNSTALFDVQNKPTEQVKQEPASQSSAKTSSSQATEQQKLIVCLPDGTYKEYIKQ